VSVEGVENDPDLAASRIAAAIGEPARARMLYCLLDGHARTSTELAIVGEVSPSTASVHLSRLRDERLINMMVQGKHRYYRLEGPKVAKALEALSVLAGGSRAKFVPRTPTGLRTARTCYDHLAGTLGVAIHDRFKALKWIASRATGTKEDAYDVTATGTKELQSLGIEVDELKTSRRRFAYACLDWSERRPHMGGALAAGVLKIALKRKWVFQDLDSRALEITSHGRREMQQRLGLSI
jgi:DNA-binding transcriptional ArsR family regulator